jgi:hypothetical protein
MAREPYNEIQITCQYMAYCRCCDTLSIPVDQSFQMAPQKNDKEAENPDQESGGPY